MRWIQRIHFGMFRPRGILLQRRAIRADRVLREVPLHLQGVAERPDMLLDAGFAQSDPPLFAQGHEVAAPQQRRIVVHGFVSPGHERRITVAFVLDMRLNG
jgi:hypothetical protein